MRLRITLLVVFGLICSGCSGFIKPAGRIVKDGKPYQARGGTLQVSFIPINDGDPATAGSGTYPARVKGDGSFMVPGQGNKGIPRGKYRVTVQVMPPQSDSEEADRLKGAFGPEKSPFVFDLTSDSDELVLDLGRPPS